MYHFHDICVFTFSTFINVSIDSVINYHRHVSINNYFNKATMYPVVVSFNWFAMFFSGRSTFYGELCIEKFGTKLKRN